MSLLIYGVYDKYAQPLGQTLGQVRNLYSNLFRSVAGYNLNDVSANSIDPLSKNNLDMLVKCPYGATEVQAHAFFDAIKVLPGFVAESIYAMPEPLPVSGTPQQLILAPLDSAGPVAADQFAGQSTPDGFCTNYRRVTPGIYSYDYVQKFYYFAGEFENMDFAAYTANGGKFESDVGVPVPWHVPYKGYLTEDPAYPGKVRFYKSRKDLDSLQRMLHYRGFSWFEIQAPFATLAEYSAYNGEVVPVSCDNYYDLAPDGSFVPITTLKQPPAGWGVQLRTKYLRFMDRGKWYVVEVTGEASKGHQAGIENIYSSLTPGQESLAWKWASRHPAAVGYGGNFFQDIRLGYPGAYWLECVFHIRQGRDAGGPAQGPKLDADGILDEVNGTPSTLVSLYPWGLNTYTDKAKALDWIL